MSQARCENSVAQVTSSEAKQFTGSSRFFTQVESELKIIAVDDLALKPKLPTMLPFPSSLCLIVWDYYCTQYSFPDLSNLLKEEKEHNGVDEIELELTDGLKQRLMQYSFPLALYFIPHSQWPEEAIWSADIANCDNPILVNNLHLKDNLKSLNEAKVGPDEIISKRSFAANSLGVCFRYSKHLKITQQDLQNLLGEDFTGFSEHLSPLLKNQLKTFLANLDDKFVPDVCKPLMAAWRKMRIDSLEQIKTGSQTTCNFFQEVNDNVEDLLALYWLLGARTEKELNKRITIIKTPKLADDETPPVSDLFLKILDSLLSKSNGLVLNGKA